MTKVTKKQLVALGFSPTKDKKGWPLYGRAIGYYRLYVNVDKQTYSVIKQISDTLQEPIVTNLNTDMDDLLKIVKTYESMLKPEKEPEVKEEEIEMENEEELTEEEILGLWEDAEQETQEALAGEFFRPEPLKEYHVTFLSDVFERRYVHWNNKENKFDECLDRGCPHCEEGKNPTIRYIHRIEVDGEELTWDMPPTVMQYLIDYRKKMGTIEGAAFDVIGKPAGRGLRFTFIPAIPK